MTAMQLISFLSKLPLDADVFVLVDQALGPDYFELTKMPFVDSDGDIVLDLTDSDE